MRISKQEQETIILYNEDELTASVYTYSPKMKKSLAALQEERPQEVKLERQDTTGAVSYLIPKKWVKLRPNRILTEEQRRDIAERFKKQTQNTI